MFECISLNAGIVQTRVVYRKHELFTSYSLRFCRLVPLEGYWEQSEEKNVMGRHNPNCGKPTVSFRPFYGGNLRHREKYSLGATEL